MMQPRKFAADLVDSLALLVTLLWLGPCHGLLVVFYSTPPHYPKVQCA